MRTRIIGAGILAIAAGWAAAAEDGTAALVGKTAPEITVSDWINGDGRTTLKDFRGEVVLLEFWKTH
jgi:hypothetical protein